MDSETITMTKQELAEMQKNCAQEGARLALAAIGLADEKALEDISDLRDLLSAFRSAKAIVWQTVVKYITMFALGALSFGVISKLNS